MGSTFGTYNIAYSGMAVSQASLATTTANLSNINTTGASRVRVAAAEKATVYASTSSGSGVSIAEIARARSTLLDSTYRAENTEATYWSVKSGNLEYISTILSEFEAEDGTASDGLQGMVEEFFTNWEELTKDPTSQSNRQAVTEAAASLVSAFQELDSQLTTLQKDAVNGAKDGVEALNDLASQVAALNKEIKLAEATGGEADYLRDQRDALLDDMSSLADIKVSSRNGDLQVTLGGVSLVSGSTTHTLSISGDGSTSDPLKVTWDDLDCEAVVGNGSIKAYIEDADQTGYSVIDSGSLPYSFTTDSTSPITSLRQALNDMITTLAVKVNELHSSGYDLNGTTGIDFFTPLDSSQGLSIANLQVNPSIAADSDLLAAAGSTDTGDNTIATAISNLSSETCYTFGGMSVSLNDFYENTISWLGTAGSDASSSYDTQKALTDQVDNERQKIFGISMDDEMSDMIRFQKAYSASAQVLSTIDSLIGDLIQELG